MITGTTKTGFAFEVDEAVLDNMELVDLVAEGAEDPLTISRIVKMVFGTQQRQRLYDHLRTERGQVPPAAVAEAVADVFLAFGPAGKN